VVVDVKEGRVIVAAPIVRFLRHKTLEQVKGWARHKGYGIELLLLSAEDLRGRIS